MIFSMKLDKKVVKYLIANVEATHEHELSCGGCFQEISKFAELKLLGKSPEEAMPLVQEHLDNCHECKEEYEALLEGVKKLNIHV
jgi:predicted RNase H-like HicB family nuclease